MEGSRLVDVVQAGGGQLLAAAEADLGAPVPACPAWRVSDLLGHVSSIYHRTAHVLAHGLTERPAGRDWYATPPADGAIVGWFEDALGRVADELRAADPLAPAWSFSAHDHTAGFWQRRLAHETTMHRVDAEAAVGVPGTVWPDLAHDGIDEAFDVLIEPGLSGRFCGDDGTVHLHATDVPGEWLVTLGPEGVVVDRSHAKGTAALRGGASALLLWLWGRGGVDQLEVFGDRALLDQLRSCTASVT